MLHRTAGAAFFVAAAIIILGSGTDYAVAESDAFTVYPESLDFYIDEGERYASRPIDLFITSNVTHPNVDVKFYGPYSSNGERISETVFKVVRPDLPFTMPAGVKPTVFELRMELGDSRPVAGNYTGILRLYSEDTNTFVSIPISVAVIPAGIHLPLMIAAYFLVAAGVAAGFITKYLSQLVQSEHAALKAGKEALASLEKARREKRGSKDAVSDGFENYVRAYGLFHKREYAEAEQLFRLSKELWDNMKGSYVPLKTIEDTLLELRPKVRLHKDSLMSYSVKKSKISTYILGAMLVVAILATWQGIAPEILSFDDPVKDGIAAFLLGFGSQALVQYVAPILAGKTQNGESS